MDELGVLRCSSEFSNQLYDDHLKISLLVLKQNLNVSYRELCSALGSLKIWKGRIPNHSTLVKFSKRMKTDMMDRILRYITEMLCGRDMIVAA
ncbi:MAG: hypothetical protein LBJ20_05265, partial [Candidatus Methanoplasma sp.]|nr:hypothetical protein [Candidatus Methanoplasma sp.]